MSEKGLFQKTAVADLTRVLDLAAMRQRTYATNVANANVPGYQRLEVPFEEEIARSTQRLQMRATHPEHARSSSNPMGDPLRVVPQTGEAAEVDLDTEMVAVAENQLRFNLAARLAALQIAGLRASIQGRR